MGLFDSVYVPCPHCGSRVEIQVEGDECMNSYTPETAPDYILRQAMNDGEHCMACDKWLTLADKDRPLEPIARPNVAVMKLRTPAGLPPPHPQGMRWWPGAAPTPDDIDNS